MVLILYKYFNWSPYQLLQLIVIMVRSLEWSPKFTILGFKKKGKKKEKERKKVREK